MNTICMRLSAVALVACSFASFPARAQAVEFERAQLTPSGGSSPSALCLRGARLMVGAAGAEEVQWYQFGNLPTFVLALHASDNAAGDAFGSAVALFGDRLVVGAPGHDHGGQAAGSAYVFAWSGTAWVEEAELLPFDGAAGDSFGSVVDISGNTVIVGAQGKDEGSNPDEGAAYVFERVLGVWTPAQKLTTPDHGLNEGFGRSVAIDGDRIAVASELGDGGNPSGLGAVFMFHRSGATWTQDGRLVQPSSSGGYGTFGQALDLAGDLVAVGHPYGSGGYGNVHLFRQSAGVWSLEVSLAQVFGYNQGGQLGLSLELFDDRLAAGAAWYSPYGFASGGVFLFQREAATWASWSEPTILVPSAGSSSSYFGRAVSFDGQHAVVGAFNPYVYTYDTPRRVGTEYCFGDGSGTPCPCGNASPVGAEAGCGNTGPGAALAAVGSRSVAADDLMCSILGLGPNHPPMILFAGTARTNAGLGSAFGDGLRCVGGSAQRLGSRMGSSNFGLAEYGPGLIALGGWSAGQTRYFQCFYRNNNGPCGMGFNMTNGLEVTFTP